MVANQTVQLDELMPGSVLAKPLYNEQREIVMDKGVQLNVEQINVLREQGVAQVEIEWQGSSAAHRTPSLRDGAPAELGDALGHTSCPGCDAWHAFRPPTPQAAAQAWYCKNCGAVAFAKFDPEVDCEYSGVAMLTPEDGLIAHLGSAPDDPVDTTPPEHLQRLVRMLTSREFKGVERRRYKRYAAVAPVVAVPLGEDFRVTGKPIRMTTTNVSHDGIGLIHTQYLKAPYYALDFTIAGLELRQAIVKLLRVRGLGPVYESGGRFVRGLSRKQ